MLNYKTYSFEKLDVWQDIRGFVKKIYRITSTFPKEERFGLVAQMRDAVISVSNNLSEGTSRFSRKEQARFIEISYASLMEVLNELITSFDLEFIQESTLIDCRIDIDCISNKLGRLYQSQVRRMQKK